MLTLMKAAAVITDLHILKIPIEYTKNGKHYQSGKYGGLVLEMYQPMVDVR